MPRGQGTGNPPVPSSLVVRDPLNDTTFIYISSRAGAHMFTVLEWKQLLQLARDYDWTPEGTLPPPDRDELSWDRSYYPGYGQAFPDTDAALFARALDKALLDIPSDVQQPVTAPPSVTPVGMAVLERYRGPRIALLRRLLLSAQAGELRLQPAGRLPRSA